jgi:hypothetical protein
MTDEASESFKEDEEKEKRYHQSMINAKLFAYKQRARDAGIPERYVGIGPKDFYSLLAETYHITSDERKRIASFIYKTPHDLAKIPFILIDGGNMEARKMASFALLYRLITSDMFGKTVDCSTLAQKLNTFDPKDATSATGRIGYANDLKDVDVLAISEFRAKHFHERYDGGSYLDSILDNRYNNLRPTIISFQDVLSEDGGEANTIIGNYMANMYEKHTLKNGNPNKKYFRIRVKKFEDE